MKGVNKAILIGNVGKDPETRFLANGDAVVTLSLATSEKWKDKVSGETVEKTEWHRVVAFRKLAEIIGKFVKKGSPIYIEGKIKTSKWQDKDGSDRYMTEIEAQEMQMLGKRQEGGQQANKYPEEQRYVVAAAPAVQPANADFDDEIPF